MNFPKGISGTVTLTLFLSFIVFFPAFGRKGVITGDRLGEKALLFRHDSEPVTKRAYSEEALSLLNYLTELHSRTSGVCLSGQAVSANANPANELSNFQNLVVKLGTQTNQLPAVLEYGTTRLNGTQLPAADQQIQLNQIFDRYREGHLIYLTMRPANPQGVPNNAPINTPDFYVNDVNTVILETGKNYGAYRKALEYMAGFIRPLQEAGIAVVFEPFNEFNGQWNWMGNMDPDNFKKLYKYTHDYFTKEQKFNNLLFIMEYSATTTLKENIPVAEYYPGDDYVDILGFDFYDDNPLDYYTPVYNQLKQYKKPIALSEFGPNNRKYKNENDIEMSTQVNFRWDNRVQLSFMKSYYPQCCFFIRWQADWAIVNQNHAKEFMDDPWLVNLARYRADRATSYERITDSGHGSMFLYPNPALDRLIITASGNIRDGVMIEIFAPDGGAVLTKEFEVYAGRYIVDIRSLRGGMYYCRVISGDQSYVTKFLKL